MKRIVSLIITIALIFSFSASVYADSTADAQGLTDIKDHWAEKEIKDLYNKKIITGNTKSEYEPRREITRGEFVTLLVKVMGYSLSDGNSFSDVGYNRHWAKNYIETAVKEGVIDPEKEGAEYWPDMAIKRFDMALMMFKALKFEYSQNPTPFPDVDCGCMTRLYEEYLIYGSPEGDTLYFKPSGLTTKAEAATIIARVLEYSENPKTYKAKKLAEAKEKEFIEPEMVIRHMDRDWDAHFFQVVIKNIEDYDYHYMFKVECLNDNRINFAQMPGHKATDLRTWRAFSTIKKRNGEVYKLQDAYTGTEKDRNSEKYLPINQGDKFDFKVTIIKTIEGKPLTDNYYKPTAQDNYKEYYISGTVDLDAFKSDPEYVRR